MAHWLTNRAKYDLIKNDPTAGTYYMGLIDSSTVPAAMDTEAEIQDLNTVSELLALTGVDEPVAAGYARTTITNITVTEDDTNNRVNIDSDDVAFAAIATGANIRCGFIAKELGADSADLVISVFTLAANIPTNGSGLTFTVSDLVRAS